MFNLYNVIFVMVLIFKVFILFYLLSVMNLEDSLN